MGDLNASGQNPGTTYTPSETNGVYHEDREVALTSGGPGSQMYRVYNAAFSTLNQNWAPHDSTKPSYATVQNPDGSIHYYKLNASGTWDGSDNNTIFNGVDFGMSNTSADNSAALQKAIEAAIKAGGGTIFIPSGTYTFTNGVSKTASSDEDVGLIIAGTGGASELVFSPTGTGGGTLFTFTNFATTGNGIRLRNLRLTYSTATATNGVAVALASCQNITCEQIFFGDWATAFSSDSSSGQCGLIDCTIQYDKGPTGVTMVSLAGSQDFVRGCVVRETITNPPSGCFGISIQGSNNFVIDGVQISDFDYGLLVTDDARDSVIANTFIEAQLNAVQVKPTSQLEEVSNICFSNCVFAENQSTGGSASHPGVIVTANGGADTNVTGILFDNCIAYGWGGAGIEVDQGQNIVISGGQYSSNGQTSTNANLAAGIAVAGGAQVTISGADCSGVNQFWQTHGKLPITQPTGVAISNDQSPVSDVTINGCNLQANTTAVRVAQSGTKTIETVLISGCDASGYSLLSHVLAVTGTPTGLEMIDCAGYNDQNTQLNGGTAPTTDTSAISSTTPYYGPSLVLFSNPTTTGGWTSITVGINRSPYPMGFGSIYMPRPIDQIKFPSSLPNTFVFQWVGK